MGPQKMLQLAFEIGAKSVKLLEISFLCDMNGIIKYIITFNKILNFLTKTWFFFIIVKFLICVYCKGQLCFSLLIKLFSKYIFLNYCLQILTVCLLFFF